MSSYAELARQVLDSESWPDEPRPQARSLAALFSKLDREQELDWLADRLHVQKAIAAATGRPLSHVTRMAYKHTGADAGAGPHLRWVPFARDLDLARDSLCPGFPVELEKPARWEHAWWQVEDPAEAELVLAWHQARGRCTVLELDGAALDRKAVCIRGPVLLKLSSLENLDLDLLLEKPELCIAAPFLPEVVSQGANARASRFQRLAPPQLEAFLDPLVSWVAQRLPEHSAFDTEQVASFIRRAVAAEGLTASLSVLLSLCGAIDELELTDLSQTSLQGMARRYVDHRLRQVDSQDPATFAWLRRVGFDVLTGLCARIVVDARRQSLASRNLESWLELVPQEYQRGGDLDWMRLAVAGTDSPIGPRDIAEAAKRITPGSFRIVRALSETRLLANTGHDQLSFTPAWLSQAALNAARTRLLDGSALGWGEALLNPHEAASMLRALMARTLDQDFGPIETMLELETEEEAAGSAALEASFVAVGIALLAEVDVPQDLLENLWDETLRGIIDTDSTLPVPRMLFAEARFLPPGAAPCFEVGWFYLAALAISEQLPEGAGRSHAVLRPWSLAATPPRLSAVYDSIASLAPLPAYATECRHWAVALVDRIRSSIGQAAPTPHQLEWPGIVLDEATHDVLSQETLEALDAVPDGVAELFALSVRRNCDWQTVTVACWRAWQSAGCPGERPSYLAPESEHARLFWGGIPTDLLQSRWLASPTVRTTRLPFEHFGRVQWAAFTQACSDARVVQAQQAAFDTIPREAAAECLGTALDQLPEAVLCKLWQRFDEFLQTTTALLLDAGKLSLAFKVLEAAPQDSTETILQLLERCVSLRSLKASDMRLLRLWLVRRVTSRGSAWQSAYEFLKRVEDTLAPLRASGLRHE